VKKWSRVLGYFRPELPKAAAALLLMFLSIGASLLKPWPVALIIDHVLGGKPGPSWFPSVWAGADKSTVVAAAALLIFALHLAQGILAAAQNYLSIKAGLAGLTRIRTELFDWMQKLSLRFYQTRNQGDLIYRATWDTYSLQTIFQQGLFKFVSSFATVLLMLVVMWRLNPSLALITLAVFPPLLVTMYSFGRQMNRRSLTAHQADSRVTSLVQQNISALPVVQSYVREGAESAFFAGQAQTSFRERVRQHSLEVIYWLAIATLFGVATAGLTWWGAEEILRQRLTIGELVIFLAYLGQLYDPLNQLSHVGATVSDANAGLHRIFEILDARESVPEPTHPVAFPVAKPASISLSDVTFGYEPGKQMLNSVTIEIAHGEIIGLIGPSGSGKTTLLNLIPRFFDPDTGTIRISGVDIRQIGLAELRRNIAYVFQEPFLLPGTVADNIAYGHPHATRAQIEQAAELANAREFIFRMPNGYDTVVGEGATRLSVGEKQRINIARAFLKNAPILLLDEPTSALDSETEAAIIDSLTRLIANRTTIMAAHRLSTMKHAHRIAVLEHGTLSEVGTSDELLRRGGYFARAMERRAASR
jgi:ATP-binding cassette, subfamily B, bacterial